ncbi:MAG: universal stress protein [Actinobacteria bacterium]|nr:universal stress protein [Actinomycetota bacterium]MCO5298971.1 universal stress protein [Candidatus Nanopelagicales bacterium]HPE12870.1 universal stress protein [Actinomycetota bacterium]HRV66784.1 universal stress protein [Candidatus Nanopelagicales bacterium]
MSVVVGYDGSDVSAAAVRFAAHEAKMRGLDLEVLTAWDQPALDLGMGAGAVLDPGVSDVVAQQAAAIAAEGADLVGSAVTVTSAAVMGPAAAALVERGLGADLVILGSQGRNAVSDLLLGGVSRQVAAHCQCPVIVVRDSPAEQRVVVGIDGSPQAGRALDFAFDEASRRHWSLQVVHAWDVSVIGFDVDASTYPAGGILDDVKEAETRLSAEVLAGHRTRYPDVEVEVVLRRGAASQLLMEASASSGLMVIGSRGRGGFASLLLGSVSHRLLHRSQCTIAIIH